MGFTRVLSRLWAKGPAGVIVTLVVVMVAATGAAKAAPKSGGTLTVLEGAALVGGYPAGLDPGQRALTTSGPMMDAIYGDLFQLGPNDKLVPDLATGYSLTNGNKTLTLHLRHGVKFSDGTPFNASAVVFNYKRYLANAAPNNPQWPKVTSVTSPSPYTVVVNFAQPDGAAVTQMFDTTVSWIVSPTSLAKMGPKAFLLKPVGAGPFTVVSDTLSVRLVLKKNPNYWQKGHPYLDGLTFSSVASDASALEDLQAKNAQAYQGMATPQLVSSYEKAGLTLTKDPGTGVIDLEINDAVPPMNNIKAREALYYALNASAISKSLFKGSCSIDESFTGPGGLFYSPKVPNYRSYDLAKAKALVKQLGGLNFTMNYLGAGNGSLEATAIQPMFKAAGMNVKLNPWATLTSAISGFDTHKWQVNLWAIGAFDPAGGAALDFFLLGGGPFSGINDPTVNADINKAAGSSKMSVRSATYKHLASYLNQKALMPFVCAPASWDVAAKGVSAPGLTTAYGGYVGGPMVQWQNASVNNNS
ncbi:MAG: ABC transporter substrate-binding protein [Acidimicrobiaceae bacterium]|nr:ABC transporter substrate-binding protein [Acidimicrobiaceae bacterium]